MTTTTEQATTNTCSFASSPQSRKPLFRFLPNWYGYIIAN